MGIALAVIVLALIFGGFGLFVKGLLWLLVIAGILLVVGVVLGYRGRTTV
ncbi:MAG TPA: hypothetical protein VE669_02875 [Actinomycetota bacterium]|jgi:hypothetical protein|nr:hypothetical protein [Actinomycetota bacterium]